MLTPAGGDIVDLPRLVSHFCPSVEAIVVHPQYTKHTLEGEKTINVGCSRSNAGTLVKTQGGTHTQGAHI